jgi:hypothetical protein
MKGAKTGGTPPPGAHRGDRPIRRPPVACLRIGVAWLLALCAAQPAAAERQKVCTFELNSADEVGVFRDRLPAEDFELVDLTPDAPPASGTTTVRTGATPWLPQVCREDLRCDVVVFSAEFGGCFFGTSGLSLGLPEMEAASCQDSCDGLFHAPREVFLLGCNTLATKAQDRRTPADYLQVLLSHGFERSLAERVVALRYGPLGSSFRETQRRVWSSVPRIYGFASVAPSGPHAAPVLNRYFDLAGDYRRHLEVSGRSTARNTALFAAFRDTAMTQIAGLTPDEPAAADREEICALHDSSRSVAERLRTTRRLLQRDDFLAFLPNVELFVSAHPRSQLGREELAIFEDIRGQARARDEVLELVRGLPVSALRMELANLAVHLDWMSRPEFRRIAVDGAHELLGGFLTSEEIDIVCEIVKHEPVGDTFEFESLPDYAFQKPEGLRLLDCLSPPDPRVSARLVEALDDEHASTRLWAGYALSRRLPLDDQTLRRLAPHLADPSPALRERLRWIFLAQAAQAPLSDDVRRAVGAHAPEVAAGLAPPRPERRRSWWERGSDGE